MARDVNVSTNVIWDIISAATPFLKCRMFNKVRTHFMLRIAKRHIYNVLFSNIHILHDQGIVKKELKSAGVNILFLTEKIQNASSCASIEKGNLLAGHLAENSTLLPIYSHPPTIPHFNTSMRNIYFHTRVVITVLTELNV